MRHKIFRVPGPRIRTGLKITGSRVRPDREIESGEQMKNIRIKMIQRIRRANEKCES